jgi:D-arabinose 1-dehydrogenase-like Zn-dependent alcohol dehydrogenase
MAWCSGSSIDSQDTLTPSASYRVRSIYEILPLDHAEDAYEPMMGGKVRFRSVITTGN